MRNLLLFLTVLLALQAVSSGTTTSGFKNYTRSQWTSQDDLDGVHALTSSFEQLNQYSTGDPCGELWPWLLCSGYPARVAFLYLSGRQLSGNLPDFSKLDGLQMIYMSDNELDGPIPDFLGKLPHLFYLDLSNNQFSGRVPKSITSNENLSYDLTGNRDLKLPKPKKKKEGLIIGLVIGIPVAIAFAALVIAFIIYSRRNQQVQLQLQQQQQQQQGTTSQGQVMFVPGVSTPHGMSNVDIGSMSMTTEPASRPSHSVDHLSANEENVPTAPMFYGSTNQTGAATANNVHNIDDDEIAELLRQRNGQA